MPVTCHSEFGKVESLFINPAAHAFVSDEKIAAEWQMLNYTMPPSLEKAIAEYDNFVTLLRDSDIVLQEFPAHALLTLDAIYCRDASLATDRGMILCNMGKQARQREPQVQEDAFRAAGIPVLGKIEPPGTVEGGDVAWLDAHTLAVGLTYRTNAPGIAQLKALLNPMSVDVVEVPLPHYRGPGDVFHLMSILSPVDRDLAVVYSPLMPISFRQRLLEWGYGLVEVPESEFDSMGCNVLAVAPRKCIMVKGNPRTRSALEKAGCEVREYEGQEISVKGGGGPTCLTRPIRRTV